MKELPQIQARECTIEPGQVEDRIALLETLRASATTITRTPDGLRVIFPISSEDAVHRFSAEEKGCCTFWDLEVRTSDGGVELLWEGPPDTSRLFDKLEHAFCNPGQPFTITDDSLRFPNL